MSVRIDEYKDHWLLREPYSVESVERCRGIPAAKWSRPQGAWVVKPYQRNLEYIDKTFSEIEWSTEAKKLADKVRLESASAFAPIDFSALDGVPFAMTPMEHQKRALLLGRDKAAFAYLMEQGTGKTKVALDDAAHNYRTGQIDALIVVAPNSVKSNWVAWDDEDAVTQHMAPDIKYHKFVFNSDSNAEEKRLWKRREKEARDTPGLVIIAVNYEALLVKRCYDWLFELAGKMKTMIVFDESTKLKKPGSNRSKWAKKLRKQCVKARLLTGTLVVKRPVDAFSQFAILDESIMGFTSFYSFRNHFCNMGGFQGKQVISYKNLDELADLIAPYSFRVTKDQCLGLPPKIYMPLRKVKMTDLQVKAYNDMKDEFAHAHKDGLVEAPNVLAQIMRLQQITSGYIGPEDNCIELMPPDKNPKFLDALGLIDEAPSQVIVWARFSPEIEGFCRLLAEKKITFRRFDGSVSNEDRLQAKRDFLDRKFTVMVANAAAGGMGQDWYTAETVIYLSNSFSTEDRVQSEDRAHRKGTINSVAYYDIVVPATEDMRVLRVMKGDLKISDMVMNALEDFL